MNGITKLFIIVSIIIIIGIVIGIVYYQMSQTDSISNTNNPESLFDTNPTATTQIPTPTTTPNSSVTSPSAIPINPVPELNTTTETGEISTQNDPKITPNETPTPISPVEPESVTSITSVITYTDNGYNPLEITIVVGTSVTFKNESSRQMWTASDPHPIHNDYSEFDQKGTGTEYSFTFNQPGIYDYHNHVFPTHSGQINVITE